MARAFLIYIFVDYLKINFNKFRYPAGKMPIYMFKRIAFILIFLYNSLLFSQIGGRSVYQFLSLVTSPRQAALGGKVITIYDNDVNQGHFNPASINPEMDNKLAVNYGSLFGDVTYGTASYAYTYDRHVQTFHVGVNYVNYGKFDGYDALAQKTSSFTGSEIALSFGYAYNIPFTDIHLGANAKVISSALESYNSVGVAADFGAVYIDEKNDINYSLVLRNMGTQVKTYAGTKENLPFEILLGISQELENVPIRWHLTLDNLQQWKIAVPNPNRAQGTIEGDPIPEKISFLGNALRHTIIGVELFPQKSFNLRLGYNFRRAEELSIVDQRNFSGISIGFGLKMNKLKFNYAYSRYSLAGNTNLFGLSINFADED